jgi:preprotein translocase subunit SecE
MTKDDATWLKICYVSLAGLFAFLCYQGIAYLGLEMGWSERYAEYFSTASAAVAVGVGSLVTWMITKPVERREYHLATIAELRRVHWPSLKDTRTMTIVVVVVVSIFGMILAIFDVLLSKLLQYIL